MNGVREETIIVDGLAVSCRVAGEGQPLLIIHGWGSSALSWAAAQEILAKKNMKVVALDLPGFGGTPPPPTAWGVKEYAAFIRHFADAIGFTRFILLGHSFGGQIAIQFAFAYSDRVSALVLCSAAGVRRENTATRVFKMAAKVGNAIFAFPLLRIYKKSVQKLFYRAIRRKDYLAAQGIMKDVIEKVLREDLTHELPSITARTLIVWGARDTTTPLTHARIMQEAIPNAALRIIKEARHSPYKERPGEFTDIVSSFLET